VLSCCDVASRSTPAPPATNLSRADWMLRQLGAVGYRLTGPRAAVVRAVAVQSGAVTAEQLVAELGPQGVSRATVYRTLDLLEQRGLLARMHLDSYHGYTVCDDSHHHHLLCHACGQVMQVDASGVEAEIHKLAQQLEFRVDTHTLEFSGVCQACQARPGSPPATPAP
jgi:Fur family transcriptional regulator, ferric uptake regulator